MYLVAQGPFKTSYPLCLLDTSIGIDQRDIARILSFALPVDVRYVKLVSCGVVGHALRSQERSAVRFPYLCQGYGCTILRSGVVHLRIRSTASAATSGQTKRCCYQKHML